MSDFLWTDLVTCSYLRSFKTDCLGLENLFFLTQFLTFIDELKLCQEVLNFRINVSYEFYCCCIARLADRSSYFSKAVKFNLPSSSQFLSHSINKVCSILPWGEWCFHIFNLMSIDLSKDEGIQNIKSKM